LYKAFRYGHYSPGALPDVVIMKAMVLKAGWLSEASGSE
jgi:hypothetical protein